MALKFVLHLGMKYVEQIVGIKLYLLNIFLIMQTSIPVNLREYEASLYSQNGEDGVIEKLFEVIGVTNRVYVEFGVEDGTQCNTRQLREQGWTGLLMDGSNENPSIQLQKDLIQEKEESATELTLAVDKAVLETMEHELITRETKINEAVALLRKVEFKSKNQQHNHTATATSNLKVLQLKYDRKEKELDRRQSIIKQKDQELKMLKEALATTNVQNEKDTMSFRKQSVRKENVLKEQINELKTKLEANSEIHLQLDQSKRELR